MNLSTGTLVAFVKRQVFTKDLIKIIFLHLFLCVSMTITGCGGGGSGGSDSSTKGIVISNMVLSPSGTGQIYVYFNYSSTDEIPTYIHVITRDTARKTLSDTLSPIGGNKNLSGIISGTMTLSEFSLGDYEIEFSLKTDSGKTSNLLLSKITAQWSLGTGVNYPTQSSSNAYSDTAIGDLNGDGRNDIVVIGPYIYYQNSTGGFGAPVSLDIPYWISGIKIADVNNDGRDDLIVAGKKDSWGTIRIFHQDNVGNLLPPIDYQLASTEIGRLTVADLDGDGLNDIAVMTGTPYGESHVTLLFQKPDGTFEPENTYKNVGTRPFTQIFTLDIYGSGRKALVFQNSPQEITIMQQTAWRTFEVSQVLSVGNTSNPISAFAVGDVNGDGRPDVVATTYSGSPYDSSGTLAIFIQSANGGFGAPVLRQEGRALAGGIRIADINQDGLKDILCDTYGGLLVIPQKTDHSLDITQFFYINNGVPLRNEGLSIGDVNGDGMLDVVLTLEYYGLYVMPYAPTFRIN